MARERFESVFNCFDISSQLCFEICVFDHFHSLEFPTRCTWLVMKRWCGQCTFAWSHKNAEGWGKFWTARDFFSIPVYPLVLPAGAVLPLHTTQRLLHVYQDSTHVQNYVDWERRKRLEATVVDGMLASSWGRIGARVMEYTFKRQAGYESVRRVRPGKRNLVRPYSKRRFPRTRKDAKWWYDMFGKDRCLQVWNNFKRFLCKSQEAVKTNNVGAGSNQYSWNPAIFTELYTWNILLTWAAAM